MEEGSSGKVYDLISPAGGGLRGWKNSTILIINKYE